MAAYRKKAADDRDALFGGLGSGGGGGGKSKKPSAAANRDELFGGGGGGSGGGGASRKPATSRPPPQQQQPQQEQQDDPMARLREMKKNKNRRPALQGEVRAAKLKEATDYRDKANKCMQKGFFAKPDPVAASTYFKRAADAYQQVGDMPREERLYRLQSGQCNIQIQAWASVASDYTRAADLLFQQVVVDGIPDATIRDPGLEASSYHQQAAQAWTQKGEQSKAAAAQVKAAVALNSYHTSVDGGGKRNLSKPALTAMEEAVEAHVPDVFNHYARYRQTGQSAFLNPDSEETVAKPSPETLELARQHIVTAAYAHEPLLDLVHMLVEQFREYPTALYAIGAASYLLEKDGHSTISTSRAYVSETILLLAAGDAVAAQEVFLQRHVQKTFYLQSRECKLAEELFRAILDRDPDALEETRSPAGSNKAALANLHSSLRVLVTELRVSGVARKAKATATTGTAAAKPKKKAAAGGAAPSSSGAQDASLNDLMNMKTGYEKDVQEGAKLDPNALADELDNLDFDLGGDDDDDNGFGGGGDDDDDDDDIDLR